MTEQAGLSQTSLPKARLRHIGIIMDGNGRWAKRQRRLRTQGHLEGMVAAKRVVKAASDLGV
ncbi:MAG: undecaprenyl diphosphate synthase family protein, partial [Treponema sp.]|nr:undecaprenyl diphosphate synthase family protein [Treponema sp.]